MADISHIKLRASKEPTILDPANAAILKDARAVMSKHKIMSNQVNYSLVNRKIEAQFPAFVPTL